VREAKSVVSAYVFIQTSVGMGPQVASAVGRIDGVLSSDEVTGPYDVIARAEAPDLDDLGKLVASYIHTVTGITRTITCIRKHSI
jgi:DNA-binding Lrp family transcriptional regulator